MRDIFTIEEINLIYIFDTSSRENLIAELVDTTEYFDEPEVLELAISVIDKLSKMSDSDFSALELNPIYEEV